MSKILFRKDTVDFEMQRNPNFASTKKYASHQVITESATGSSIVQNMTRTPIIYYDLMFTLAPVSDRDNLLALMTAVNWAELTFFFSDWEGQEYPYTRFVSADFTEKNEAGYNNYYDLSIKLKIENHS